MKKALSKRTLMQIIAYALIALVFVFDLIALFQPLQTTADTTLWSLATSTSNLAYLGIIAKSLFYVSLVGLLLPIASFLSKKNFYIVISHSLYIVLSVYILIVQLISNSLSVACISLALLSIFVSISAIALLLALGKSDKDQNALGANSINVEKETKKNALGILIIDIVLALVGVSMFFIPLTIVTSSTGVSVTLINALLGSLDLTTGICFIAYLIIFFLLLILAINTFVKYFLDHKKFVSLSRLFVYLNIAVSFVFFVGGFVISFIYNVSSIPAFSVSLIPFAIDLFLLIFFSFFLGRYRLVNPEVKKEDGKADKEDKKPHHYQIEPLIYVVATAVVTVLMLFLCLIRIRFTSSVYNSYIAFTGIELLSKYGSLGAGFQALAFALVVVLIIDAIGLVITFVSFFTHSKNFSKIVKSVVVINVFCVFLFGIAGLYFAIAQKINTDNFNAIIALYSPASLSYEYVIETDAYYALIGDVVLLILMFIRKVFERDFVDKEAEKGLIGGDGSINQDKPLEIKEVEDDAISSTASFDPCPAFSEMDKSASELSAQQSQKEATSAANPSLNDLCSFVVDYARNSRLHLSYSSRDIATFIAGLGSARLAILQGMSGTGKTSLPKIFMEAIAGECDIVEVESSWKDKNELLGYYNEFSNIFTPKKFTLYLYKASLEKNVPTFIVLDELNLSRIEYYFSDFLSLMEGEENKRILKLSNAQLLKLKNGQNEPYLSLINGRELFISPNIWFIGTANRDDSTFVISDKVYDRANTMNFMKRAPKVRDYADPMQPRFYSYEVLAKLFKEAKTNQVFDAESNIYVQNVEKLLKPYNISFGNRILNQMEDFVKIYKACFPHENVERDAIETILLNKVVAKLEVKSVENKEELAESFKNLGLLQIAEFVEKLDED